jgi:uncharacterized RDD family membrane protein YckC
LPSASRGLTSFPTRYDPTVDDDRPANLEADADTGDPPRQTGSILSAGAPSSPVAWTVPGSGTGSATGVVEVGQGIVLAGIGTRIAAFLVDVFVLSALAIVITLVSAGVIGDVGGANLAASILVAVVAVAYFAVAWVSPWAATPGQRLAGMRVVDATTLGRIGAGRAIVRSLALGSAFTLLSFAAPLSRFVDVLVVIWSLVLLGSALFDARRRGVHDRWTRTLVVRPARAGSMPLALGCFLIVLLIFLAPVVITMASGGIQQILDQLPVGP